MVVDTLNKQVGLPNYSIHFARFGDFKDDPTKVSEDQTADQTKYRFTNFRYNSQIGGQLVIDRYDEIWCFGAIPFDGDQYNNPNKLRTDNSVVTGHIASSSESEVRALTGWMDAGGGLLAMGDHGLIGSAMNWNVPRVGSMRAWLRNDDLTKSVTDRDGVNRHDTNRPTPDTKTIATNNQSDEVPQTIVWRDFGGTPHPLFSYRDQGGIDVFPDHAHEGKVLSVVDKAQKCWHDNQKDEFPKAGEFWPGPEVIAFGSVLGDGYFYRDKGEVYAKDFPLVSAYDGHHVSVGRVVVDSTWHHWLDLNLAKLPADVLSKVSAFHTNTAVWLASQAIQKSILMNWLLDYTFALDHIEDVSADSEPASLGQEAMDEIGRHVNDGLLKSCVESVMGGAVSTLLPLENEMIRVLRRHTYRTFIGCVIRELVASRDLTLQRDEVSLNRLRTLEADWLDQAMQNGTKSAIELIENETESSKSELDKFVGSMKKK